MRHLINLAVAFLTTLLPAASAARGKPSNAVLLSSVKSLTLRDGALTSARRVDPIPQLTVTGGNANGLYKVDSMRCTNTGSSYDTEDIEWTCQASLPPEFKLGSTEVICEGYNSPDDPYILKGSCGVEYRLVLTEYGEEKYGRPGSGKFYKEICLLEQPFVRESDKAVEQVGNEITAKSGEKIVIRRFVRF